MSNVNDPAFRADADKRGADLSPMPGEGREARVAEIVRTPAYIVRTANDIITPR